MCPGHKVDAVYALIPQPEQHIPQPRNRDGLPALAAADIHVLAEDAAQIAAGEEDRAGAVFARDAGLLPVMRGGAGNARQQGRAAEAARHSLPTHRIAAAGTEITA